MEKLMKQSRVEVVLKLSFNANDPIETKDFLNLMNELGGYGLYIMDVMTGEKKDTLPCKGL